MLPLELNKLLIIVVVLSMALTPLLNEIGRWAADFIDDKFASEDVCSYIKIRFAVQLEMMFELSFCAMGVYTVYLHPVLTFSI